MFYTWVLRVIKDIPQMDASPDSSFLQTLATDRMHWHNFQDAVVQLYWQSPMIAARSAEWTAWKHPLIAHLGQSAFTSVLWVFFLVATWLDRAWMEVLQSLLF